MIQENLEDVQNRIRAACSKVDRDYNEVTLIAVSKTKPIEMIRESISYGIIDFGENKVQELCDKVEVITEKLNWHLIGHLQRNKVKYIVDKVCLIHSVDSMRLAAQIDEEARKKGVICDILLEVNIAQEDTKFGVFLQDVLPLIMEIKDLKNVKVKGLMTIAPFVENPEENREYFRQLQKLKIDIKCKNIDNIDMEILSMGMTNDYEIAIQEGATMVRVGTGIFGNRKYIET